MVASALVGGVLSYRVGARPTSAQPLKEIVPDEIGAWTRSELSDVLIPRGEEIEGKTYDDVLTGYYTSGSGAPIMLLIAYGSIQTGNTQLHRPEACYPSAGFRLGGWSDVALRQSGDRPIAARTLTAMAPGRIEQILYWSRIGRDFPTSSVSQRWSAFRHALSGSIPDGALVRISTINGDQRAAIAGLNAFAGSLLDLPDPAMRRLLIGRA
jgi:EpsI family protein